MVNLHLCLSNTKESEQMIALQITLQKSNSIVYKWMNFLKNRNVVLFSLFTVCKPQRSKNRITLLSQVKQQSLNEFKQNQLIPHFMQENRNRFFYLYY
jgi:hypothetical protein